MTSTTSIDIDMTFIDKDLYVRHLHIDTHDTHDIYLPDNWLGHPGGIQEDVSDDIQHTCHHLDAHYVGGQGGEDGGKGDQINAGLPINTTFE